MSEPQTSEHGSDRRHGLGRIGTSATPESDLIDQMVDQGPLGWRDRGSRDRGRDLVTEFVIQVLDGSMTLSRDATAMINARIAQIDHLISIQLNEILHHPTFQSLEAAWRGLSYVIDRVSWFDEVKVRILNVKKSELLGDLQRANTRRESALHQSVVARRSEALGSEPFSILVGNYKFGHGPEDVELLERVSSVATEAHALFVAAASPEMFGGDSFTQVLTAPELKSSLQSTEYAKWSSFRQANRPFLNSRFVVLSLPGILLRKPFGWHLNRVDAFNYEENVDGTDHSKLLWGNPAWAVAAQIGRAFGKGSWCADMSEIPGGQVLHKLPVLEYYTDEGDIDIKGPAEAAVSDFTSGELYDLGFTPLRLDASGKRAVVGEPVTTHQSPAMENEEGEVREAAPVLLREMLVHCRIAHYLKCIVREKRLRFRTPVQCEQYINRWCTRYTVPAGRPATPRADTPEEQRRPFLHAEFHVVKDERRPKGWFRIEGQVTPNTQQGETALPVDISVPVLLTRSAAEWKPPLNQVREDEVTEDELEPIPPIADETAGPHESTDSFSNASLALERIASLRRRNILDEADYLELKTAIISKMKRLIEPATEKARLAIGSAVPSDYTVPYAQLHSQIVDLIAEPYGSGMHPNQRAQKALSQMEASGALNDGDSPLLNELLAAALSAAGESPPTDRLDRISEIAARIREHRASPASKAIADTAEESGKRAVSEYASDVPPASGPHAENLWQRLVWPDVEGAFSGGAAAAVASPTLQASQFFWPLQIAAAFGAIIGAGIRSGVAYGERKDRRLSGAVAGA